MPELRHGSLCTGYGGLDIATQNVYGGRLAWTSDIDPGAARIIAHRMPGIPNLGDLTTTDWIHVEPVDIVTGGYPCQPFSTAGKRKGTDDERHIWPYIADALRVLRPRYAIFENVAGHLRLGFDTVLADLAAIGFDAEWCLVRASEIGAPHARQRLFLYAVDADPDRFGSNGRRTRGAGRDEPASHRLAAAHARGAGLEVRGVEPHGPQLAAAERGRGEPASDSHGRGLTRHPERDRGPADGQPEREPRLDADGRDVLGPTGWGRFAPAVARWESVTGRRAPWATDDRNRLSPAFVEWLMGLDAGHVTDVPDLTRTQQLKALGNGVVPQQAEAAIRLLHARAATPPAV